MLLINVTRVPLLSCKWAGVTLRMVIQPYLIGQLVVTPCACTSYTKSDYIALI